MQNYHRSHQDNGMFEETVRVNEVIHSDDGETKPIDYINAGTAALGSIAGLVNAFKGGSTTAHPSAGNPNPTIVVQQPPAKSGMSTGAIVGLIGGGLVLFGVIAFLAFKK